MTPVEFDASSRKNAGPRLKKTCEGGCLVVFCLVPTAYRKSEAPIVLESRRLSVPALSYNNVQSI